MKINKIIAICAIGCYLFTYSEAILSAQNILVDTSPPVGLVPQEVRQQGDHLQQTNLLLNSLSIGGYLVTAGQSTGGGDFTGAMAALSYERWLSPSLGCELNVRYADFFFNRPLYWSVIAMAPNRPTISGMGYNPARWLSASWGTDVLVIIRPLLVTLPQFRVGIGVAFDSQIIFKNDYVFPWSDTATSIIAFARAKFSEQTFFGIAGRVEYGFPLGETVDIVLRSQMYLQSNNLFRPIRRQEEQYYGAFLLGASLRVYF